ncbi:MAG TPA: DUF2183 domain-containing protein [Anaerolineae bacterium]|nr:DUF2183 domain-containing protein [Anaerolineae bacterium]HMR63626.1 DUF2183 domain-containing protein [Anaerolineae bacterium]
MSRLGHLIKTLDSNWSYFKFDFKKRLNLLDPLQILPYFGFGTADQVFLKGRVLEQKGITGTGEHDSLWQNLKRMYRRFESDEVPGAVVAVKFQGAYQQVRADHEGFFETTLRPARQPGVDSLWHPAEMELVQPRHPAQPQPVVVTGQVLIPQARAQFGVISDIDDTVVETAATNWLKMARIVLFSNAYSRLPFEGVSQFYQALQAGKDGNHNPIFYVSSSPWNLYDLLVDFFQIHDIPLGPLLLQDYGFEPEQLLYTNHREHKLKQIKRILLTYSHLSFILIGDSGQQDPEIYREVVHQYPGRIAAIYIRDVTLSRREQEIKVIAEGLGRHGVEMLLVKDTQPAFQHAAARGFIN